MVKLLWVCDGNISRIAESRGLDGASSKLKNCVKIKLLRKILIAKNFDVSKSDYTKILGHHRFLLQEET